MKLLINSQTSTAARLKFGMDKWFHPTFHIGCNSWSLLGLTLIHVSNGDQDDNIGIIFVQLMLHVRLTEN